jgi:hypothetical protein
MGEMMAYVLTKKDGQSMTRQEAEEYVNGLEAKVVLADKVAHVAGIILDDAYPELQPMGQDIVAIHREHLLKLRDVMKEYREAGK